MIRTAAAVLACLAGPAAGQDVILMKMNLPCWLTPNIGKVIKGFGETRAAMGAINRDGETIAIVELTLSDNGSWTIIRNDAKGISCVLASGTGWEAVKRGEGL